VVEHGEDVGASAFGAVVPAFESVGVESVGELDAGVGELADRGVFAIGGGDAFGGGDESPEQRPAGCTELRGRRARDTATTPAADVVGCRGREL
jgi:hypothetical protein